MLNKRILTLVFVVTFLTLLTGCLTPPNQAPILTSDPITTATVDVLYTYDVNATDPDGDTLTYSLAVKPTGMTISSATGLIMWTPVAAQVGDNSVTVKVSDGSLSITQNFIIKVSTLPPVNQAPVIYSTPITTAIVGVAFTYNVNATDPDGDTLTYSLTTYPSGMTISSATGLIMWTPTTKGNYAVVVKVSDGVLSDTQGFTIVVGELPAVNQAPVIYSTPITTAIVGVAFTYDVNATDPDGDTLTYSLITYQNGMTINPVTGVMSWIPTSVQIGIYGVTVKVSDGELSDTQNFTITVSAPPVVNQAPIIYSVPIDTANVGVLYTYDVNATDPDGDTLTYSLITYQNGMTINPVTGVMSWIPTSVQIGIYGVTVKVSDGELSDTQNFTITVSAPPVVNQAPVASFTASPTSGVVPLEVSFDASSSYDSDGNIISYTWDFKDGNTGSGETLNHTFSSTGNYDVKLTVTDNKGATDSTTKTITATEPIDNEIVYRALCVGVGDYVNYGPEDGDLNGPPYDVDRIIQVLSDCNFGSDEVVFSLIVQLKDLNATKEAIINGIASTFSGADYNDISYFYFSGHGSYTGGFATSYICPTDILSDSYDNDISVNELESALRAIPGTKVVILDSCFSGGFIGKGKEKITISKEDLTSFNNEIINVFFQAEYKGLLTTNQYKVLTSCRYHQVCYEILPAEGNPYGVFTISLCEGCGYYGNYPADTDTDTKVSLQEAYLYVKDWVQYYFSDLEQDVQVYPNNSDYTIVEY